MIHQIRSMAQFIAFPRDLLVERPLHIHAQLLTPRLYPLCYLLYPCSSPRIITDHEQLLPALRSFGPQLVQNAFNFHQFPYNVAIYAWCSTNAIQ